MCREQEKEVKGAQIGVTVQTEAFWMNSFDSLLAIGRCDQAGGATFGHVSLSQPKMLQHRRLTEGLWQLSQICVFSYRECYPKLIYVCIQAQWINAQRCEEREKGGVEPKCSL